MPEENGGFRGFLFKLGGRKFLMALAGAVAVALGSVWGVSEETTMKIAGVLIAFIIGEAVKDTWGK